MRQLQGTTGNWQYTAIVPEKAIFIYSRHTYAKLNIRNLDGTAASAVRVQGVVDYAGKQYTNEYRYTDNDGNVTFDFAAILQTAKNDRDKELASITYDATTFAPWQMGICSIRFYIGGVELRSASTFYELVNGAHDNMQDWWSKDRRLKWWTSYPFTFDFTNQERVAAIEKSGLQQEVATPYIETSMMALLVRFNAAAYLRPAGSRITIKNISHPGIAVEDGIVIGTDNYVTLDVERCSMSDRKTYLRWLGTHGEVFYWLFDNITESVEVKTETFRRTMVDDMFQGTATNLTRDNGIVRDCSSVTTRSIATEMLDGEYYDLVSSIGDSVAVDMYLGDNKWQRVNVADATFTKDIKRSSRGKRNRITLTIQLSER
jgi:hypothetical protein